MEMPKYRYFGTGPCRYGVQNVQTGDIVDASAKPGKNFVLVQDEPQEAEAELEGSASPSRRRRAPSNQDGEAVDSN